MFEGVENLNILFYAHLYMLKCRGACHPQSFWHSGHYSFILGIFFGIIFGFYFSVWAQYHSGGYMILGRVNAVDDGIPMAWLMAIFTYFAGQ